LRDIELINTDIPANKEIVLDFYKHKLGKIKKITRFDMEEIEENLESEEEDDEIFDYQDTKNTVI
jgi:hypothetical protein